MSTTFHQAPLPSGWLQAFHSGRLLSTLAGRKECRLWAAVYDPRAVLQTGPHQAGSHRHPRSLCR